MVPYDRIKHTLSNLGHLECIFWTIGEATMKATATTTRHHQGTGIHPCTLHATQFQPQTRRAQGTKSRDTLT